MSKYTDEMRLELFRHAWPALAHYGTTTGINNEALDRLMDLGAIPPGFKREGDTLVKVDPEWEAYCKAYSGIYSGSTYGPTKQDNAWAGWQARAALDGKVGR